VIKSGAVFLIRSFLDIPQYAQRLVTVAIEGKIRRPKPKHERNWRKTSHRPRRDMLAPEREKRSRYCAHVREDCPDRLINTVVSIGGFLIFSFEKLEEWIVGHRLNERNFGCGF